MKIHEAITKLQKIQERYDSLCGLLDFEYVEVKSELTATEKMIVDNMDQVYLDLNKLEKQAEKLAVFILTNQTISIK